MVDMENGDVASRDEGVGGDVSDRDGGVDVSDCCGPALLILCSLSVVF